VVKRHEATRFEFLRWTDRQTEAMRQAESPVALQRTIIYIYIYIYIYIFVARLAHQVSIRSYPCAGHGGKARLVHKIGSRWT
jgi:hypothetical protein